MSVDHTSPSLPAASHAAGSSVALAFLRTDSHVQFVAQRVCFWAGLLRGGEGEVQGRVRMPRRSRRQQNISPDSAIGDRFADQLPDGGGDDGAGVFAGGATAVALSLVSAPSGAGSSSQQALPVAGPIMLDSSLLRHRNTVASPEVCALSFVSCLVCCLSFVDSCCCFIRCSMTRYREPSG